MVISSLTLGGCVHSLLDTRRAAGQGGVGHGSVGHGSVGQDPGLEESGDLLVGDGVAQRGDELQDIS